jgi:glucose/arabinose dehydrogenase
VYLAFLYHYEGKGETNDGHDPVDGGYHFLTKIVRFTYDAAVSGLTEPQTICDSIPGSNDHNGGRLLVARVGEREYLFYSVGDMGAGQFKNANRINYAQDPDRLEGKILRFNTEPDQHESGKNAWIPDDNPFNQQRQNAVWTLGHRNPQGLAALTIGGVDKIYSSEHGPFSDDEVNKIEKGKNYGHPLIIGYADGNYNGLAAGVTSTDSLPGKWNTRYPLIANELHNARKITGYADPLKSFYPTQNSRLRAVFEKMVEDDKQKVEWVSLAPSGICSYSSNAIPGWKNSLLIASLKEGKIVRLALDNTGSKVLKEEEYFQSKARYRAITVSGKGDQIYVTTDNSTVTSGPTEKNKEQSSLHGVILEFSYAP